MKSLLCSTLCLASLLMIAALAGCTSSDGKANLIPNPDKNLDKPSSEFAADAAKRSYETTAAKGGPAAARASYDQMTHRIDLTNTSDTDWTNVEVWLNQTYVVFIPAVAKQTDERLDFELFYDQMGHHFDTEGGKNPIKSLELFRDGKMYTVSAMQE